MAGRAAFVQRDVGRVDAGESVFAGKGTEDRVRGQPDEGMLNLIDHGELGKGEDVDGRTVVFDQPAGLFRDGLAHGIEEDGERRVEWFTLSVLQAGEADPVLALEQVGERGVHLWRVIGGRLELHFAHLAVEGEVHRDKDKRRAHSDAVGIDPGKPAQGGEEDLDPLLTIGEASALHEACRAREGFDGGRIGQGIRAFRGEVAGAERDFAFGDDECLPEVFGEREERKRCPALAVVDGAVAA
jgi:hypothetical protein